MDLRWKISRSINVFSACMRTLVKKNKDNGLKLDGLCDQIKLLARGTFCSRLALFKLVNGICMFSRENIYWQSGMQLFLEPTKMQWNWPGLPWLLVLFEILNHDLIAIGCCNLLQFSIFTFHFWQQDPDYLLEYFLLDHFHNTCRYQCEKVMIYEQRGYNNA